MLRHRSRPEQPGEFLVVQHIRQLLRRSAARNPEMHVSPPEHLLVEQAQPSDSTVGRAVGYRSVFDQVQQVPLHFGPAELVRTPVVVPCQLLD